MKHREVLRILSAGFVAMCVLLSNGCGGKSAANLITVTISSSSGFSLILGQSTTLTATVTGATNTNVNWTPACQYTTTTSDSTGKVTTSKPANCPRDTTVNPQDDNHTIFGVFSNQQASGTEVFTAPSSLPDQTKYPGLQIIVTAQSVQDTKRTGTITLTINSGIRVTFTPGTATVPVKETQRFTALLTNDLSSAGVTWSITQQVPNSTAGSVPNPYTPLATCSPTCGTIKIPNSNDPNTVEYTAPNTVPTAITPTQKNNTNSPANVTIVAVSNADKSCSLCVVIGTITIVPGGPITFNTITPTIAPQGATLWDIYLDAPNVSSATTITLTYPGNVQRIKKSDSGQIKVLFPVPASSSSSSSSSSTTCSTTNPCSTGARLRLNAEDLATSGSVTVSVVDPAEPCNTIAAGTPCTATGTSTFTIMPVRPTSTATVPDDIVQGAQTLNFPVIIDGGYFGPFGPNVQSPSNFIRAYFQSPGNDLLINPTSSSSRQLVTSLPASHINPSNPGLYPLYVASTASPAPTPPNPSVTNMAIFPDYSKAPAIPACLSSVPAGTNPSAVDIDPTLGVLVVAEAGSPSATPPVPSAVQFYGITTVTCSSNPSGTATTSQPIDGNGAPCTPSASPAPGSTCPYVSNPAANYTINVPTGISVDRANHTVAVVNYGDQSVTVLQVPVPGATQSAFTPFNISLSGALENSVSPAPLPYSIGVDPDSHLALVAYSSTSASTAANLGFIVNLNPDSSTTGNSYGCPLDHALTPSSTKVGQCLFSQVTLNTGTYPQVAVSSHGHSALVTPGGSGVVREVDVTKPSTANFITSASLSAGVVTVVVSTQCPPGVSPTSSDTKNPCPLTMLPGAAGSVLIAGLNPKNSANKAFFNGVFTVGVTSNTTFTYAVPNTTATDSCQPASGATSCAGEVFYSQPDQIFGLTATSQGIAINPITSTAAIADANATGNNGAQINLLSGLDQSTSSILFSPDCTAFTTTCSVGSPELLPTADVAWQPFTNSLVSYNPHLNQVSVSDPVSHRRYAFACASSSACQVNPIVPSQITLSGTGTATLAVQNGTTNSLNLFGGLAVDPVTNQAFVVKSGSGAIDVVDLGGAAPIKPAHISEVIVPSPPNAGLGTIGGIPNALVPQAALTCTNPMPPATCNLPGVRILGSGFASGMTVRLDGVDITTQGGSVSAPLNGGREVDVTIPASSLTMPHHFALDVLSSGAQSNAVDFIVVQSINLSKVCAVNGSPTNTMPSSVAIADQIANGLFSPFALVSVTGCNSIVQIDVNPTSATFGQLLGGPISVGTNPQGIAIWQHQGLAVVANNGAGTASVIDLTKSPPAPVLCGSNPCGDVTTGTNSTGVAINEATGAAIVTNTGSNTISMINLALLFPPSGTTPPTSLTATSIGGVQQPTAVAIDPDRGANNQGLAVVASIQLSNGSAPIGSLTPIDIDRATPNISTTASSGFVSSIPTGIVFDPAVVTNTTNPGVFFANSSGTNSITAFNPDNGQSPSVSVGVNPTSLAVNPQTGALLTANSASNTISIVDTLSSPFKTRQTLGIPGSPTFGVAIDQFTNLAVIVDQANMRVLLFPMPN